MKKILAILLAMMMVLSLAACGGGGDGDKTPSGSGNKTQSSSQQPEEPIPEETKPEETEPEASAGLSGADSIEARMEASYALQESLDDETERQFFNTIIVYGFVYFEEKVNGIEMPTEEVVEFLQLNDQGLGADGIKSFVSLLEAHRDEIDSGFICDKNGYWVEEGAWYSDSFESLYSEFHTSADVPDTAEEAFNNLSVTSNILYDQDGVTVTFDRFEYTDSNDSLTMFLTLSNNNDSNKKVTFLMNSVYVNGVNIWNSNSVGYLYDESGGNSSGIENETTAALSMGGMAEAVRRLNDLYGNLGITFADAPMETVRFDYRIQIGSNSDSVAMTAELQTTLYQNGDSLTSQYGDHYTTLTAEADGGTATVDTYGKLTDTNSIFAVRSDIYSQNMIYSGLMHSSPVLCANGVQIVSGDYQYYDLADGMVFVVNLTEDDLRKQCEIGNDETLNITLEINDEPQTIFSK